MEETTQVYGPHITKKFARKLGLNPDNIVQPPDADGVCDFKQAIDNKGTSMSKTVMESAKDVLGGPEKEKTPEKEVREVRVRKAHGGKGHIIEHHHKHPEHHPMEEHVTSTDDEMAEHMLNNMGNGDNEAAEGEPSAADKQAAALGSISNAG